MQPMKLKLGSLPKPAAPQLTPVPGAPPSLLTNNSVRPTASGSQTVAVKSPKAKSPGDMAKSSSPDKGVGKLKSFMDNRISKKNKVSSK